ncbi:MAG: ABC transporter ATP-binding protein [Candidatus Zapsychrus exili]|nr:ABC transporter ATP-binding protein [Candidatus Zapsychrus exili]
MVILQAIDVHKSFSQAENTIDVLKGIDLKVEDGQMLCIVGPSGAGKSTLLHMLGGLDKPIKGSVFLNGENIYSLNDAGRAKVRNENIGFVFQFYHLLPEFTSLENVILPALIKQKKKSMREIEEEGAALLERVGLKKRISHRPSQLSGGEQQRVAIARALINNPDVVLCDEPTGNLDSKSTAEIKDLLVELNERNNQTFVIVTHDENIASFIEKRLYMRDGKLI